MYNKMNVINVKTLVPLFWLTVEAEQTYSNSLSSIEKNVYIITLGYFQEDSR